MRWDCQSHNHVSFKEEKSKSVIFEDNKRYMFICLDKMGDISREFGRDSTTKDLNKVEDILKAL